MQSNLQRAMPNRTIKSPLRPRTMRRGLPDVDRGQARGTTKNGANAPFFVSVQHRCGMRGFSAQVFLLFSLAYAMPSIGLAQHDRHLELLRIDYHGCVSGRAHRYLAAGKPSDEIVEQAIQTCSNQFERLSAGILDAFEAAAGASAISQIFATEKANAEIARNSQQARREAALIASEAVEATP